MFKTIRNCVLTILATLAGCSKNTTPVQTPSAALTKTLVAVRGDKEINLLLLKLLRAHGLNATTHVGWIRIANRPYICGAIARELQPTSTTKNIQIDIYVALESGRILVESFAGIGETKEDAIVDGIHNFTINSFHVLLAAFYVDEDDDQVEKEKWKINGQMRRVTIGNIGIRGTTPIPDSPPTEWFQSLENAIRDSELPAGTHWVRCYYGQMQNEPLAVEVLLDNEDWPTARTKMQQHDWPKSEDYYSVRIFLIIQDDESEEEKIDLLSK